MGKRSFVCRSFLGGQLSLHVHAIFFIFWLLWYCVDVLISGGSVSFPKHFVTMVYVLGVLRHLKFRFPDHFYLHVILSRLISLFILVVFFTYFCLGISDKDALLVKYISCTICIFLRNTGKHDMCSG